MRLALTLALQDFEGALVVVSHDRHLLRTVTDTLLLVVDGKVSAFEGDIDDYRQWVKDHEKEDTPPGEDTYTPPPSTTNKKQQRQIAAEMRKKIQPLRNKVKKLEQQIEKLNVEKAKNHERLSDSAMYEDQNKQHLKEILEAQSDIDKQLQIAEEQWMEAQEELDALE